MAGPSTSFIAEDDDNERHDNDGDGGVGGVGGGGGDDDDDDHDDYMSLPVVSVQMLVQGAEQWAALAQLGAWGARLSVALHRANCRNAQSSLGAKGPPSLFWPSLVDLRGAAAGR